MTRRFGIFLALSLGVSASAQADETAGRWRIGAEGGACSAATSLGGGQLLMIFSKPPGGENNGGLMIGQLGSLKIADGPTVIELAGQGSVKGKHHALGYADLGGYWLPFGSVTEMHNYPDSWQLLAKKDGQELIDQPVTQFKLAVATLDACAAKPG
jgi:hypothetical protein